MRLSAARYSLFKNARAPRDVIPTSADCAGSCESWSITRTRVSVSAPNIWTNSAGVVARCEPVPMMTVICSARNVRELVEQPGDEAFVRRRPRDVGGNDHHAVGRARRSRAAPAPGSAREPPPGTRAARRGAQADRPARRRARLRERRPPGRNGRRQASGACRASSPPGAKTFAPLLEADGVMPERDQLEVDVLFVGGGPAGLAGGDSPASTRQRTREGRPLGHGDRKGRRDRQPRHLRRGTRSEGPRRAAARLARRARRSNRRSRATRCGFLPSPARCQGADHAADDEQPRQVRRQRCRSSPSGWAALPRSSAPTCSRRSRGRSCCGTANA